MQSNEEVCSRPQNARLRFGAHPSSFVFDPAILSICEARGMPQPATQQPDVPPATLPPETQPPRTPSMEAFIAAKALMLYEEARQPDIVTQMLAVDLRQQCDRDGISVAEVKACVAEHVSGLDMGERSSWLQRFLGTLSRAVTEPDSASSGSRVDVAAITSRRRIPDASHPPLTQPFLQPEVPWDVCTHPELVPKTTRSGMKFWTCRTCVGRWPRLDTD
jgi:hypothetical protein